MFSRATKLIVRSVGSRQFHISGQNLKNVFIGGAGEISRAQSQLLRNSMKLNVLALYNVAAVNKPLPNRSRIRDYCGNQLLTHIRDTKELVEALYHLPIAEGAPTLNHSSMSNEIISKAGKACSGLCPHARLLDKIGPNGTRTRQRDCANIAIHKCFPGLMCSPFQEYIKFIAATLTSRRHLSIKDKDITRNSLRNISDAKESNCQSLSPSLLDDEVKPTGRSTRKFNNAGKLLNTEISCRMKMSINRSMSETLLNNKLKWLRDIYGCSAGFIGWFPVRTLVSVSNNSIPISRDDDCFRERLKMDTFEDNATIRAIVEKKNRIQRVSFEIKSILSNRYAQSRLTAISDSYNRENIPAVNEALAVSVYDLLSDRTILFAPKDCDSKFNIRRKLEKICALWDRLLRGKDRDDICKKRRKPCTATTEGTCQKRGEMCQRRTTDCSERRERACEKHTTVLCSGRKSSCGNKDDHDFYKTRKEKCQKQSCMHHGDSPRTKVDPCKKHQRAEPAPCKRQESKEATCTRTKEDKRSTDKNVSCKQREVQEVCQKKKINCEGKKEKDCSDMKKVKPRKTRECPPVKRAPDCPKDSGQEEDC